MEKLSQDVTVKKADTYTGYAFEFSSMDILLSSASDPVKVTVAVKDDIISRENLPFVEKTGTKDEVGGSYTFYYKYTNERGSFLAPFTLTTLFRAHYAELAAAAPEVRTLKGGYHPGKKNPLPIFVALKAGGCSDGAVCKGRLRILNSKGKYVFQKVFDLTPQPGKTQLLYYKWNGKAGKGNAAKLTAGKYVPDGKYQAEISLYAVTSDPNLEKIVSKIPSVTKKTAFQVSRKAASGAKAFRSALGSVGIYTGDTKIDYMAQQMVKAASVKLNMSDAQKVKNIYHYMTRNFKHVRSQGEVEASRVFYDLDSLASQVSAYETSIYKYWKRGSILFDSTLADSTTALCMQRRAGTCENTAAIFKLLLAHVGVQSGLCEGYYVNRNGKTSEHTWNWAIVDGEKYIYDLDIEIINYGGGQGDYYWFGKSYSESKENHSYSSYEKEKKITIPVWQTR